MPSSGFAADFLGLPTFFVTNAVSEVVGYNVRVYHFEKRGNILTPIFIAVLPAKELAVISRDVQETAKQSLIAWAPFGEMAH